jgi:hypothetical protein
MICVSRESTGSSYPSGVYICVTNAVKSGCRSRPGFHAFTKQIKVVRAAGQAIEAGNLSSP